MTSSSKMTRSRRQMCATWELRLRRSQPQTVSRVSPCRPEQHVKAAVTNVQEELAGHGKRLPPKCVTPFSSGHAPWLEDTPELKADGVQRFQELIGQLRWAVEIGRVDILLETSLLSSHLAMSRTGHLEQAFHIFGYLKTHPKRKIAFDPAHPAINENRFQKCDWTEFYRDAREAIPNNMPTARGKSMSTHCFVDANHAGDSETRRSQTGILLFCNSAFRLFGSVRDRIQWKHQHSDRSLLQ